MSVLQPKITKVSEVSDLFEKSCATCLRRCFVGIASRVRSWMAVLFSTLTISWETQRFVQILPAYPLEFWRKNNRFNKNLWVVCMSEKGL
jgi:hypothetical protein